MKVALVRFQSTKSLDCAGFGQDGSSPDYSTSRPIRILPIVRPVRAQHQMTVFGAQSFRTRLAKALHHKDTRLGPPSNH
jgi:hypothetical protein